MKTSFYFRLEKESNMASDENDNPCVAYVETKIEHGKAVESEEQYKVLQGSMKTMIAGQLKIEESYVTPITEIEYLENVVEEQTTCDDCGLNISEEEYQRNNGWCNECLADHYEED